MNGQAEQLRNLTPDQVRSIAQEYGTPLYVYSKSRLLEQVRKLQKWQMPYGQTLRYAMKANPHPEVVKTLYANGILIDASSGPEAELAMNYGVAPEHIMLTSQQLPQNLTELLERGVKFNACSLRQLEEYCRLAPNSEVSVRINPGVGDGQNNRLTTGGANAAFGIWHDYASQVKQIAQAANIRISQLHTHIGTGTNPEVWASVAETSLRLLDDYPDAQKLSLGGGFKVKTMTDDTIANISQLSSAVSERVEEYAQHHDRKIHVEIEPGRYYVANCGTLLTEVIDVNDTGSLGHQFAIVNSGMNDFMRPAMYGAQHPLVTVTRDGTDRTQGELLVAGHCCESSDMFTLAPDDPETIAPRNMFMPNIGDYICLEVAGAYGAGMRASMYNSFEPAKEVFAY